MKFQILKQNFLRCRNLTLRRIDQKYLESSEIWYWRKMEKIRRIYRVNYEEVLRRIKEERNILH